MEVAVLRVMTAGNRKRNSGEKLADPQRKKSWERSGGDWEYGGSNNAIL